MDTERDDFVYLDTNATTPVDPRVAAVVADALVRHWANPSSVHVPGRDARSVVERARQAVADALGAAPEEVVFTSGGTESDNWALRGAVAARPCGHIVVSAIEHPAVLATARALEHAGAAEVTVVPVRPDGVVDPDEVEAALRPDTALVSVMLANNETGVIQPVAEIAARCRRPGILIHTDAAQAIGKIPVSLAALGVDLLTVAGHKLYAPKGVGALLIRAGAGVGPLLTGAGHELGRRAGTENTPGIAGLGEACAIAAAEVGAEAPRLAGLRDRLEQRLAQELPGLVRHGATVPRLPNTASVALPGVDAHALLAALASRVGASPGAACHAEVVTPSHVLAAMGVPADVAARTVRFSVGRFTTTEEVDRGADLVIAAVRRLTGGGNPGAERS